MPRSWHQNGFGPQCFPPSESDTDSYDCTDSESETDTEIEWEFTDTVAWGAIQSITGLFAHVGEARLCTDGLWRAKYLLDDDIYTWEIVNVPR